MASRRTSKSAKFNKIQDYSALVINDVSCPICRSILIEPVTLPCSHGMCLSCFQNLMENTNLVCPLCRLRIASWLRKAKKEGRLVNQEFWNAIKDKFPHQVKNKLIGLDENIQEKSEIVLSCPGEIRKEYELQIKKEDEEILKKREADLKASEDLIKKLKDEEDYQKLVTEEKLKLDEQVAKKLAEQLYPSTSQLRIVNKKFGPMDKFVKKDNETVTSQNVSYQKNVGNNFANKEYTCRVLHLDNHFTNNARMVFSPIIRKKIQQIQKIVDADTMSDGSDCIESEMRYFKPIDHSVNPPSRTKAPIKIPSRKAFRNSTSKIVSPSGSINFHSNILSAFARISSTCSRSPLGALMRIHSENDLRNLGKRKTRTDSDDDDGKESPTLNSFPIAKRKLLGKVAHVQNEASSSPPFYGFDTSSCKSSSKSAFYGFEDTPSRKINEESNVSSSVKVNGVLDVVDKDAKNRLLQEKADLEFAKKLQDELNKLAHNTRSARRSTAATSKRPIPLDKIVKSRYRVK